VRVEFVRIRVPRIIPLLSAVIVLNTGAFGSAARSLEAPDPQSPRAVPARVELQIEALIQHWFAVLEDPTAEPKALLDLLADASFALELDGEAIRDRDALLAWASKFRAKHSQVKFSIDPIRVTAEGRDLYRARFEFDRHAVDPAGLPHVARREQSWLVRSRSDEEALALAIEERPLMFFPGTGPQIVCY